ncbi:MAG: hypothetical protein IJ668_06405 [Selenomonadaceae bacterium]|nr:hypothetical protein [Selenomonadaceae bacterium]MBR1580112.1 hypothetical protein [Selenomonadaceae bacterium]
MKEAYLRPSVIDSAVLEFQGIFPLAAIGAAVASAAAGVGSAAAAAASTTAFKVGVAAGLGLAAASSSKSKAFPTFRLPSFKNFSGDD